MKITSLIILVQIQLSCLGQIQYPLTKEIPINHTYHDITVADPYQWMESLNSQEVESWSKGQESILSNYLKNSPTRERIQKRLSELTDLDLYSSPTQRGGIFYYSKNPAEDGIPKIYSQKGLKAKEELLINPALESEDFQLLMNGNSSGFTVSEEGNWLAYNLSKNNQRWFQVQLYNLKTKKTSEILKGFHSTGGGPVWYKDEGFYYNRFQEPKDEEKITAKVGNSAIFYHKVGTDQSQDRLVLEEDFLGGGWYYSISVSSDNKYLIVGARKGSSTSNRVFIKKISSNQSFTEMFTNQGARYLYLGNNDESHFFYTDLNASNGKIVSTSIKDGSTTDVIPESREVMSANSLVGGNAIGYFNERFVIKYTLNGESLLKIFDKSGKHLFTPSLPLGGSIWGGINGAPSDNEVFYQFLGLIDPSSIYKLDLRTGEINLFKRSIGLHQDDYVVEKVEVKRSGADIPMFIARKKTTPLNGTSPGFIYGYGAFGWVSFIWYQPHILLWLEAGGVYAIPGIRGGGELGSEWHEAGTKQNKQNSISDYIAASEWLIDSKYVAKNKLVANGGSISAVVAGAALNQRTDLYGAAIIDRPALDLLRFPEFTGAKAWIEELGSPNDVKEFESLYKYSPYHNIENKCYPPTLIMVGDQDETTPPLHAYKYTASLQKMNSCLSNPILLKIMNDVGHNFGNTNDQKVDSFTDMMHFLFTNLNIEY